MNRERRIQLVNEIAAQLTASGINVANAGNIGVEPGLAAIDEFMTEYLQLQAALHRVRGIVKNSFNPPTTEVEAAHLKEVIDVLAELVDRVDINVQ